jgi:hypothetical protein
MRRLLDKLKDLFRRERDVDRETSTNAQVEGASGEPYDDA